MINIIMCDENIWEISNNLSNDEKQVLELYYVVLFWFIGYYCCWNTLKTTILCRWADTKTSKNRILK